MSRPEPPADSRTVRTIDAIVCACYSLLGERAGQRVERVARSLRQWGWLPLDDDTLPGGGEHETAAMPGVTPLHGRRRSRRAG